MVTTQYWAGLDNHNYSQGCGVAPTICDAGTRLLAGTVKRNHATPLLLYVRVRWMVACSSFRLCMPVELSRLFVTKATLLMRVFCSYRLQRSNVHQIKSCENELVSALPHFMHSPTVRMRATLSDTLAAQLSRLFAAHVLTHCLLSCRTISNGSLYILGT